MATKGILCAITSSPLKDNNQFVISIMTCSRLLLIAIYSTQKKEKKKKENNKKKFEITILVFILINQNSR
jgi:hypothetical protein